MKTRRISKISITFRFVNIPVLIIQLHTITGNIAHLGEKRCGNIREI
jgi:hypothetical protein